MRMKRFAMQKLLDWKEDPHRLPLIIRGARQVGKTWLMKEFGRLYFEKCAYINFDRNKRMEQLFSGDFSVDRILAGLAIESGVEIEPENTLIILDEIQEVPPALQSLKYFCEDERHSYYIVAAGSLLGIAMHGLGQHQQLLAVGQTLCGCDLDLHVGVPFLDLVGNGIGNAAGLCKAAACSRGGAECCLVLIHFQQIDVQILALDDTGQLLKGQHKVHVRADRAAGSFQLLGGAGADEAHAGGGVFLLHHESNGNVTVSGIEDKEVREQVQKLVEEKYSDRMYQYYTGIADSVGNLSSNTYQYATDVQEVRRYLKGVTGEDISLENLYLTPDGKIGGLPGKAANLINKTKDNAKIERIKDALINIIGHNRTSGDLGIPDFTSEFQFSNGAFSVADSGFTVDMAALDRRLTPQPHDNMYSDMYAYSFRKVL